MRVRFACGHVTDVAENAAAAPVCVHCGETHIARVQARAPTFTGVATGPYATFKALDPIVIDLAPKGPLKLTPQE